MKKRVLSLVLTLVFIIVLVPVSSVSAFTTSDEIVIHSYDDVSSPVTVTDTMQCSESGVLAVAFLWRSVYQNYSISDSEQWTIIENPIEYADTGGTFTQTIVFAWRKVEVGTYTTTLSNVYGTQNSACVNFIFFPDVDSVTEVSRAQKNPAGLYHNIELDLSEQHFILFGFVYAAADLLSYTSNTHPDLLQQIRLGGFFVDDSSSFSLYAQYMYSSHLAFRLNYEPEQNDTEVSNNILTNIKNILSTIIDLPASIASFLSSSFTDVKQAVSELPDKLATYFTNIYHAIIILPDFIYNNMADLFLPDVDLFSIALEDIQAAFDEKFPFITDLMSTMQDVVQRLQAADSAAPVFSVNYKGTEYVFVDFSIFNDYIVTIRAIILSIVWIVFIINTIKKIPGILHGLPDTSSTTSSSSTTKGD